MKYHITNTLLDLLKNITLEIAALNQQKFSKVVLLEMEIEANAQSAHSSTSIEGNPLPLTDVKKLLKAQPKKIRNTEREVINYNQSLLKLKEHLLAKKFKFDSQLILSLHQNVTRGLLPKFQSGHYRNEPVFVNDPKLRKTIYWPPDQNEVAGLMKELIQFVSDNRNKMDPILLAGLFHKQFVVIHPFIDGNGRTARLLTKAILADLGIDTFYLFSFENYYNRNVSVYFQNVGVRGNYYDICKKIDSSSWLEYFAGGILDELLRVRKILDENTKAQSPSDRISEDQQKIINFIKKNGLIQDRDYAKFTKRAKATRALDFKKLLELDFIERKSQGPSTYYILKT